MVVDASVLVEFLRRGPDGQRIEQRLREASGKLHVPHIVDLEVTQAIRRHVSLGLITPDSGRSAVAILEAFPAERHAHGFLLPRIWALRHNFSAYDAAYVALAEWLDAPLLTRDRRLAAAAGHAARIELI